MPDTETKRIAIIGAGPIGLEAALRVTLAGAEPIVFERGQVAENVRDWGHVRLFSPFGMNSSASGREAVADVFGSVPADDELLTGSEFHERYLSRLAKLDILDGKVHEQTSVRSIGRRWLGKGDLIGSGERLADGFELLVDRGGVERTEHADVVLDCSGTYPNHRLIGGSGQGCPGERMLSQKVYRLQDIQGKAASQFLGRQTLVVGSGFSAATAIVALGELIKRDEKTTATWLTRGDRESPMSRIANDPLPERDNIARRANEVANHPNVEWLQGHRITSINLARGHDVTFEDAAGETTVKRFHQIIAHPGYRPDTSLYRELQVHECYATEGPIKLAAALMGEGSGDCLVQPATGPETLCNPEPGFFVLGSKSYGRNSHFLIRGGLKQIDDVMSLIAESQSVTA